MGANSKIAWTDHTFNPWWGCSRVSPGCENCYAETFSKRTGFNIWGTNTERRFFTEKHWNEPIKWAKQAREENTRFRVFCASMADVFEDRNDLIEERKKLWELISKTPELDWLLLSKRPENFSSMLPTGSPFPNIWLGITAEDQNYYDKRISYLMNASAVVRFISYEPALGPINFKLMEKYSNKLVKDYINWIIIGGESGNNCRPFDLSWARSTIKQTKEAKVTCFMKQLGGITLDSDFCEKDGTPSLILGIKNKKGDDPEEWLEEFKVREFPK